MYFVFVILILFNTFFVFICSCSEANLNGIYHNTPLGHNYIGIMWELWRGDYSLKKTRMMIRPRTMKINNTVIQSQDYHDYTEDP